jgi:heterodisulfide reductase subunit B
MAGEQAGSDVATLCAVCFNVLRRTGHFLETHPDAKNRLNLFVEEGDFAGESHALHLLGILRDDVGWEAVRELVTAPLEGLRVAPYYGCLLLRPEDEINLDDPETPTILHELLTSLGAEVVDFSHQVECCGSYLLVSAPEATKRASLKVTDSARVAEVDVIATACPLCQYNLARTGTPLPVLYFTELMAAAFGLPEGKDVLAEVVRG